MDFNNKLKLANRYVHTGNSGATISIIRDEKREDRAMIRVKIGAMGQIDSTIDIRGPERAQCDYGFTSWQLREIANMFLYAADQLEKTGEQQNFTNESTRILSELKNNQIIELDYHDYPNDVFEPLFGGPNRVEDYYKLVEEKEDMTYIHMLILSLEELTKNLNEKLEKSMVKTKKILEEEKVKFRKEMFESPIRKRKPDQGEAKLKTR